MSTHSSQSFEGLVFVLDLAISVKNTTKIQYQNFIKSHGGLIDFAVSPKTTYLITSTLNGFKAKSAYKLGTYVLSDKYIEDCFNSNRILDTFDYLHVDGGVPIDPQYHPDIILKKFTYVLNQAQELEKTLVPSPPTSSSTPIKSKTHSIPTGSLLASRTKHTGTPSTSTTSSLSTFKLPTYTVPTYTPPTYTPPTYTPPSFTSSLTSTSSSTLSSLSTFKLPTYTVPTFTVPSFSSSSSSALASSLSSSTSSDSLSGYQSVLQSRKLELEKKNQEFKLQCQKKQSDKQVQLEQKKLEKQKRIEELNLEKENRIKVETERRKSVLASLGISAPVTPSQSVFKDLFEESKKKNRAKDPSLPRVPEKSKKQLKREAFEEEQRQKKLAKEERTRQYNDSKHSKDALEAEQKEKERKESYDAFILREEKRRLKKLKEMEELANADGTPKEATPAKPDFIPKDLRKVFVGGIDFTELEKKYAKKKVQLTKLKAKKLSLLLHYFNKFGEVDERSVHPNHFFVIFKTVEAAQIVVSHFASLENRNATKTAIQSIVTEKKLDDLLVTDKFYVRLVKSKEKVVKDLKKKENQEKEREISIQKEILDQEMEEFADWTIA